MDASETRGLLQATAQGLLTLTPGESHRAIAGLIRLVERVAEADEVVNLKVVGAARTTRPTSPPRAPGAR